MCKRSNALSRPVLMVRGLDGYFDLPSLVGRLSCAVFKAPARVGRRCSVSPTFGGDSEGETPLPIPNRAVKPLSADGTWPRGPGRVGRRRFFLRAAPRGGPVFVLAHPYTDARMTFAPIAMSTLAIVLIVLGRSWSPSSSSAGLRSATRARDRSQAGTCEEARARGRSGARAGAGHDRGWDRESMEAAARIALEEHRPAGATATCTWCSWTTARASRRTAPTSWPSAPTATRPRGPGRARATTGSPSASTSAAAVEARASPTVPGFAAETDLERALIEDPGCWRAWRGASPRAATRRARWARTWRTCSRRSTTGARPASAGRSCASSRWCTTPSRTRVQNWRPKTGENHHAMRARRFAERYTDDERLLATIELHDRPYDLWRRLRRTRPRSTSTRSTRDARPDPRPRPVPPLRGARRLDRGQEPRADPVAGGGAGARRGAFENGSTEG